MRCFRAEGRIFALATLVVAGLAQPVWAQAYPTQNISVQVAFAAGGIADVVARWSARSSPSASVRQWWWRIAAAPAAISRPSP
jgi:tripartite-type tricarboxylate transporter receptor subunit TctC